MAGEREEDTQDSHGAEGVLVAGRYRLLERLGAGGMGRVWKAHDESLACDVAIKEVWLPPMLSDAERADRLARAQREARNAARMRNHPHIVSVHDMVTDMGMPWIVMDLISAQNLMQTVQQYGALPQGQIAKIGLGVLDALTASHAAGILHRDVKPANVLLTDDGRVLLTDFGIAVQESDMTMTAAGVLIGSPEFVAPERAKGEATDGASDLFSLGATLHYAAEGRSPFSRDTTMGILTAILFEETAPIKVYPELAPVISGLLKKDPTERWNAARARPELERLSGATPGSGIGIVSIPGGGGSRDSGFGSGYVPNTGSTSGSVSGSTSGPRAFTGTDTGTGSGSSSAATGNPFLPGTPAMAEPSEGGTRPPWETSGPGAPVASTPVLDRPAQVPSQGSGFGGGQQPPYMSHGMGSGPGPVAPPLAPPLAPPGPPAPPRTPSLDYQNSPTPAAKNKATARNVGLAVGTLLVVGGIVAAVALSGGKKKPDVASTGGQTASSSATTPASSPPQSPTSAASSTGATVNPAIWDSSTTDQTPFEPDSLLPITFTDSKGVVYTATNRWQDNCVNSFESARLKAWLTQYKCDKQMIATYIDSTNRILVDVAVLPLPDSKTATTAFNDIEGKKANTLEDWGVWCPKSGPGSDICSARKNTAAAQQYGYVQSDHRYLVHAVSLYVNLSADKSAQDWLQAAAVSAAKQGGPQVAVQ